MERTNNKTTVTSKQKEFQFYTLSNKSQITCHGRPTEKDIELLKKDYGINYVLTLQHDGEKPEKIKEYCNEEKDIIWHHLPLAGANMALLMSKSTSKLILDNIIQLYKHMSSTPSIIFIHCAAGVHRTGIILYTILRMTGESKENSMEAIKQVRIQTYRNVGENRIKYAEEFLVQPLLKILEEKEGNTNINNI